MKHQRALQSLEAKAKMANKDVERTKALEQQERINAKLDKLLDMELEERADRRVAKRARRDNVSETDDDQENMDPAGGWRR